MFRGINFDKAKLVGNKKKPWKRKLLFYASSKHASLNNFLCLFFSPSNPCETESNKFVEAKKRKPKVDF